ncbi:MAG TPA: AmmeMemoRadiSam system protein A [Bacillota bacterium]|nr:AmmeMemoRadiSam system protein A [Bacillota bacterium]
MSLEGFYLMPHPPIIVAEVGKGEEKKISATIDSMDRVGREIAEIGPDTIVIITPHGTMFNDAIAISFEDEISGSLSKFAADTAMSLGIDRQLTGKIFEGAQNEGIPVVMATRSLLDQFDTDFELDHGTFIPLHFINHHYQDYNIVHITYAPLPDIQLYMLGSVINRAVDALGLKAVIIASGDLSHRLTKDGPYDYSPDGKKHDDQLLSLLKGGHVREIFNMDKDVIENAAECGRKSVLVMLGGLDGTNFQGDIYSYEGPFGVGYGVAGLNKEGKTGSLISELEEGLVATIDEKSQASDPYIRLAKESLTTYLYTGAEMQQLPAYVTDEMRDQRRGVFVTLKRKGELRGCIGTILPVTDSIANEIIRNAVEAGMRDPRFYEVDREEVPEISFSVDVLTEPQPTSKDDLDPRVYGIIVKSGSKRGLLLPDLEGVDTVDQQVSIALQKAGIDKGEDYELSSFKVIRHSE